MERNRQWSSKLQHTLSCSNAEAEYRDVANVLAETAWLRNLLHELHIPLLSATLVYCDNVNKEGKLPCGEDSNAFFRNGKVGDWKNYFTPEMVDRLDKISE
uniref:Sulfotransferase n=1 Tax=Tanacetum cinerariifolium TaxID=118510 RepID=A0A6L2LDH0_TANCI|nr:ribonuclease H-like domain-containing protein [Tanacetum cinerariifolium]